MPCTEDAFTFNAQRALHQLVIYKRATQPDPLLPDALELGRYLHDGCLISKRTTKSSKPYIPKPTANAKMVNVGINAHVTVLDQTATLAAFAVGIL